MIEGFNGGKGSRIQGKTIKWLKAKSTFKNQSLEPLNPRILDRFLPAHWEKNRHS
jgi:hypothetical protein